MSAYKGFIPTVSTSSASDVWTLREQLRYQRDGVWPGPISFVGVGSAALASNNVIGVPTGVQEGDLLIIISVSGALHSLTNSTGWSADVSYNSSWGQLRTQVWYKTAGVSETSNSVTATQSRMRIVMLAYRCANGLKFDIAGTATSASSTSASTVSLTTSTNESLIIGFAGTYQTITLTPPTGVNERYNFPSDNLIDGMSIWDEIMPIAGSSTVRTATLSTSGSWLSYSLAFKR